MKKVSRLGAALDTLIESKALALPEKHELVVDPNDPAYDYSERILFLEAVGRTESFQDALAQVKGRKAQALLKMLADPHFAGRSVSYCAKKCELDPAELAGIWRDYNFNKAFTTAMQHLPDIVGDVVEDSRSAFVPCPHCDGRGKIKLGEGKQAADFDCPGCQGKKVVRRPGSSADRERLWKIAGWSRPGAVNVNVNTNPTGGLLDEVERMEPVDAEFEEV